MKMSRRLQQTQQAGASAASTGMVDPDAVPSFASGGADAASSPALVTDSASALAAGDSLAAPQLDAAVQAAAGEAAELARQAVPGDALEYAASELSQDAAELPAQTDTEAMAQRAEDSAAASGVISVALLGEQGRVDREVSLPVTSAGLAAPEAEVGGVAAQRVAAAGRSGSDAAHADAGKAAAAATVSKPEADDEPEQDDGPDMVDSGTMERAGDLFIAGTAEPTDPAGARVNCPTHSKSEDTRVQLQPSGFQLHGVTAAYRLQHALPSMHQAALASRVLPVMSDLLVYPYATHHMMVAPSVALTVPSVG